MYVVHCPDAQHAFIPYTIDASGVYVRREGTGGMFLTGISPEPVSADRTTPHLASATPKLTSRDLRVVWFGFHKGLSW